MAADPFDVVVVGAGLAGSCAALRAAELGCRVALLDAGPDPSGAGNTALSGGGMHLAHRGLHDDPFILRDAIRREAWADIDDALVDALAANAGRARTWLVGHGVVFRRPSPDGQADLVPDDSFLEPKRDMSDVHAWPERGPQVTLRLLQRALLTRGGAVLANARAEKAVLDRTGRLAGVTLEDGQTLSAPAVVIADGGFQGDLPLRRRMIGPAADRIFLRGSESGTGAGLLLGESVGASVRRGHWFYGHLMHRDVVANDRLWPWPTLDALLQNGGLLVDRTGRRLLDEGAGGIIATNVLGRSEDPAGATLIIDEQMWSEAEIGRQPVRANPGLIERGGRAHRAGGATELAREAGLPPEALAHTLAIYNGAAAGESIGALPVPRTGRGRPLRGGLIAFPAIASISFTLGGLGTDGDGHVLSADGTSIPGLYAAGATAAAPVAGYVGGLATALVFGLLAGAAAATDLRGARPAR